MFNLPWLKKTEEEIDNEDWVRLDVVRDGQEAIIKHLQILHHDRLWMQRKIEELEEKLRVRGKPE